MRTKKIAVLICMTMILGLAACGNGQNTQNPAEGQNTAAQDESSTAGDETVIIENMGAATTYETAPETAVALSYSIAEIMVALGLEDKIVAIAPSMYILDQVSEEYRETVGSFPELDGEYGVPSLETVLATNAEFVYGDSYSFYASSAGTREDYENAGVKIYATEGTCTENPTFENIYR